MSKEIDAQQVINKLLSKITQLEYENAQLLVLADNYEKTLNDGGGQS